LKYFLTAQEKRELDELAQHVYNTKEKSGDRSEEFLRLLRMERDSGTDWARRVLLDCEQRGAAYILKAVMKEGRTVAVSHDGRLITKTAYLGVKRYDGEGKAYHTQALFQMMSRDELLAKRNVALTGKRAYDVILSQLDGCLALLDAVPGAATPQDAAEKLGTTVEQWLIGEAV